MHYHQTFSQLQFSFYSSTSSKTTKERPVLRCTRGKKQIQEKSRKKESENRTLERCLQVDYTHRSFRADGCQANWLQKWLVAQGSHMAHCMSYTDSLQSALFSILVWAPLAPQSYWPVSKTANCTVKMRGFFKRWRESITFVSFPNSVMLCDLPLESILQSFKSQLQFLI